MNTNQITSQMYGIAFIVSVGILWMEPQQWIVRGCCCLIYLAAFLWAVNKPNYQHMLWSNQSDVERMEHQNGPIDWLVIIATLLTIFI